MVTVIVVAGLMTSLVFTAIAFISYVTAPQIWLSELTEGREDGGAPVVSALFAVGFVLIMFGGACAGLAGAHLSLVYTPQWTENMTAGRGWIALALVVFSSWLPWRVLAGAYQFGSITILQFHAQAQGIAIPSQFLSALPYVATIVVLVLISANRRMTMKNTPAMLGRPFVPDT